jgi:hypothetical protein
VDQVDADLPCLALEELGQIGGFDPRQAALQERLDREGGATVIQRDHDLGYSMPLAVLEEGGAQLNAPFGGNGARLITYRRYESDGLEAADTAVRLLLNEGGGTPAGAVDDDALLEDLFAGQLREHVVAAGRAGADEDDAQHQGVASKSQLRDQARDDGDDEHAAEGAHQDAGHHAAQGECLALVVEAGCRHGDAQHRREEQGPGQDLGDLRVRERALAIEVRQRDQT